MADQQNDELKRKCEAYATKYGFKSDSYERGLEAYAVHVFAQEDGFESLLNGGSSEDADLSELILRSDDLQVDGVLEDASRKKLILVQAAWRSKQFPQEKLEGFMDVLSRISDAEFVATGGDQARELLGAMSDKLKDDYSVELRFVTNVRIGGNAKLETAVAAKNLAFEAADTPVAVSVFGAAELLRREAELHSATRGAAVDAVTLKLQSDRILYLDETQAPRRTLVAVVKASVLVDLYKRKDVGNRLFNLNIRLPLTTKKVNPEIVKTATEAPEDFFYFNNGVSAVCSGFDKNGNEITAHRFQIINGAQTVSALYQAAKTAPVTNVYVLFRLTETTEAYGGDFTESVIRFNNTQNPVKVSDFFANDKIQIWLEKNLSALSGKGPMPPFYYVHKSGHKPARASGRKQLRIDVFAGIRHAFIYGPVTSYKEPAQFFDRSQKYWEAFGIDGKPADEWDAETLAEAAVAVAITDRVQTIAAALKKSDPGVSEVKYLYRLARYCAALVGFGLRAIQETTFSDFSSLASSEATFNRYVDPILDHVRILLELRLTQLMAGAVQPEYNFARDQAEWQALVTQVENAAKSKIRF